MKVDLNVPAGTLLHLHAAEIQPNPTKRDELVRSVAVYQEAIVGMVWVRGHTCRVADPDPDCGTAWCFEAQVTVDAIRANLAGAR